MAGAADPLEITVARRDDQTFVVSVAGDVDLASSPQLAQELAALSRAGAWFVVVDLAQVRFLDSTGINALIAAARTLAAGGGRLVLAAASARVRRVLEIARVHELVSIATTVEAALDSPGGAATG